MNGSTERCVVCRRGHYRPQTVTWFDKAGAQPAMVVNVPATVCDWCGDETISAAVAEVLDEIARERPAPGYTVEMPVYDLAAVTAGRT